MTIKRIFSLTIMALLLSLIINSCKKDNENSPGNPTNGLTVALFNPSLTYGTMTDQDGNVYKTVTIGTQTWMAENLRTTKYSDGSAIPNETDNAAWAALTTGAYCNYYNTNSAVNIATYGRLYNWYAATDNRNIAPVGWHIPSDAEWTTLTEYLGGESVAGDKLKEIGTTHWNRPNTGATNESGFTCLPSGCRGYYYGSALNEGTIPYYYGTFDNVFFDSFFWSSTADSATYAYFRYLDYYDAHCYRSYQNKMVGFSLRLVKD